jgi:hypothetical protein
MAVNSVASMAIHSAGCWVVYLAAKWADTTGQKMAGRSAVLRAYTWVGMMEAMMADYLVDCSVLPLAESLVEQRVALWAAS